MGKFSFVTGAQAEELLRDIIYYLVNQYGLSNDESIRLINKGWEGMDFVGSDLRYHKGEGHHWAKHIFTYWRH